MTRFMTILLLLLSAVIAQAEIQSINITVFGMD